MDLSNTINTVDEVVIEDYDDEKTVEVQGVPTPQSDVEVKFGGDSSSTFVLQESSPTITFPTINSPSISTSLLLNKENLERL